jgi:hypothetical protein
MTVRNPVFNFLQNSTLSQPNENVSFSDIIPSPNFRIGKIHPKSAKNDLNANIAKSPSTKAKEAHIKKCLMCNTTCVFQKAVTSNTFIYNF